MDRRRALAVGLGAIGVPVGVPVLASESWANLPDTCFSQSFDAMDWAKAFNQYLAAIGNPTLDERLLHGWFANAIMRGYDEAQRMGAK